VSSGKVDVSLLRNFSITWGLEDEKPGFSEKPGFFPRTIEMIHFYLNASEGGYKKTSAWEQSGRDD
jgi:hypothetical protein